MSENGCGCKRPGLKRDVKNDIFWSEIGSGFGGPGSTPPPRIPKNTTPPPPRPQKSSSLILLTRDYCFLDLVIISWKDDLPGPFPDGQVRPSLDAAPLMCWTYLMNWVQEKSGVWISLVRQFWLGAAKRLSPTESVELNLGSTHAAPSEGDVTPVSIQSRTYSVRFST